MIRLITEVIIKLGVRFRQIDQNDPNQVSDRIKHLESVNLRYYNIGDALTL
jgi:hypothetical protein